MKAIVINEFCETLDQVTLSSVPKPTPSPDELLIQVIAAGVNFVDTLYARGKHQNNRSLVRPPFTLGLEFAGLVLSAPQTCPFQPGDAVFGDHTGCFAEYITLPATSAASLRKVPSGWSFTDAAGLAATLPVSYDALAGRARIQPGETVLVHAAAGGLGIMAVQVAKALGCVVIGTAGSAEKCRYAVKFGADVCFDYTIDDDWPQRVLEYTKGKGVDVVYDAVGFIDRSLKCIAHRGRALVVGFAGREGDIEKIAMNRVLLKQVQLIGYRFGETLRREPAERERIWGELEPLLASGRILPTVSRCYDGLESVPQALKDLSDRTVLGKAVVQVQAAASTASTKPRL